MRIFQIIGLLVLLFGQYLFWVGFHNLDLTYNARFTELQFNELLCRYHINNTVSFSDKGVIGGISDIGSSYIKALRQILSGFYFSLIGLMLLIIKKDR